jgi:hypothetical protein
LDSQEVTEIKRHTGVLIEGLESRISQIAEGQVLLDEKVERRFDGVETRLTQGFGETQAMIKFSHTDLDRRIRVLEDGFSSLESRVRRLETP